MDNKWSNYKRTGAKQLKKSWRKGKENPTTNKCSCCCSKNDDLEKSVKRKNTTLISSFNTKSKKSLPTIMRQLFSSSPSSNEDITSVRISNKKKSSWPLISKVHSSRIDVSAYSSKKETAPSSENIFDCMNNNKPTIKHLSWITTSKEGISSLLSKKEHNITDNFKNFISKNHLKITSTSSKEEKTSLSTSKIESFNLPSKEMKLSSEEDFSSEKESSKTMRKESNQKDFILKERRKMRQISSSSSSSSSSEEDRSLSSTLSKRKTFLHLNQKKYLPKKRIKTNQESSSSSSSTSEKALSISNFKKKERSLKANQMDFILKERRKMRQISSSSSSEENLSSSVFSKNDTFKISKKSFLHLNPEDYLSKNHRKINQVTSSTSKSKEALLSTSNFKISKAKKESTLKANHIDFILKERRKMRQISSSSSSSKEDLSSSAISKKDTSKKSFLFLNQKSSLSKKRIKISQPSSSSSSEETLSTSKTESSNISTVKKETLLKSNQYFISKKRRKMRQISSEEEEQEEPTSPIRKIYKTKISRNESSSLSLKENKYLSKKEWQTSSSSKIKASKKETSLSLNSISKNRIKMRQISSSSEEEFPSLSQIEDLSRKETSVNVNEINCKSKERRPKSCTSSGEEELTSLQIKKKSSKKKLFLRTDQRVSQSKNRIKMRQISSSSSGEEFSSISNNEMISEKSSKTNSTIKYQKTYTRLKQMTFDSSSSEEDIFCSSKSFIFEEETSKDSTQKNSEIKMNQLSSSSSRKSSLTIPNTETSQNFDSCFSKKKLQIFKRVRHLSSITEMLSSQKESSKLTSQKDHPPSKKSEEASTRKEESLISSSKNRFIYSLSKKQTSLMSPNRKKRKENTKHISSPHFIDTSRKESSKHTDILTPKYHKSLNSQNLTGKTSSPAKMILANSWRAESSKTKKENFQETKEIFATKNSTSPYIGETSFSSNQKTKLVVSLKRIDLSSLPISSKQVSSSKSPSRKEENSVLSLRQEDYVSSSTKIDSKQIEKSFSESSPRKETSKMNSNCVSTSFMSEKRIKLESKKGISSPSIYKQENIPKEISLLAKRSKANHTTEHENQQILKSPSAFHFIKEEKDVILSKNETRGKTFNQILKTCSPHSTSVVSIPVSIRRFSKEFSSISNKGSPQKMSLKEEKKPMTLEGSPSPLFIDEEEIVLFNKPSSSPITITHDTSSIYEKESSHLDYFQKMLTEKSCFSKNIIADISETKSSLRSLMETHFCSSDDDCDEDHTNYNTYDKSVIRI